MDFDAIVVGSGISGGWVAKELCERGLQDAGDRARPPRNAQTDYQDFAAPWELAESRPGARGRSAPSTTRSRASATRSTPPPGNGGCSDSEHPYSTPEGSPVPLDARLSPRWPLAHLGAADLSLERLSISAPTSKMATASTGRSAMPTFRRGTTASNVSPAFPAPTKDSSNCPTASSCRRWSSTALELDVQAQASSSSYPIAARHALAAARI